ncbi:MAG: glycoside hydrolase family 15 protein [bacterium]|nr:glycoside hydrolase family 15 protein [bacterium]
MAQLDLGILGNASFSALVDDKGRNVWCCLPRFDGDPVFSSLLAGEGEPESGFFDVLLENFRSSEQEYLRNTAILVTRLHDANGGEIEIIDFAPRYRERERMYRPIMLVRQIRRISGDPRIRIRLRPSTDYGARAPETTHGSNHIRYVLADSTIRLTTNASVSYVLEERSFVLEEDIDLVLGPDESLETSVARFSRRSFEQTQSYWFEWTRSLSIPFEWQDAVIRAAITLKLCNFEETGAVVAAVTTSIPEAAGTERNWDYRYCWLRDAYFTIDALNRLGATRTMEGFLRFLTNLVRSSPDGQLQPVYGVSQEARLIERQIDSLPGFLGHGPVRVGNQAYEHIQNDVYGSVVLAATQSFFDHRLRSPGDEKLFERLERVGQQAVKLFDQPDAGLWELRTRARVHTFSALMCWAACNRLSKIAEKLIRPDRAGFWRDQAEHMHRVICDEAWNEERGCFAESFGGKDLDASLLLMEHVGFLPADDPRFASTVDAIGQDLRRGPYLFRYHAADDFGEPRTAFNICTFWYIGALCALKRKDEARELFENMLRHTNHLGLLSEDLDIETGELWGNFPQTYSMVGLILCAMRLSEGWHEAL